MGDKKYILLLKAYGEMATGFYQIHMQEFSTKENAQIAVDFFLEEAENPKIWKYKIIEK